MSADKNDTSATPGNTDSSDRRAALKKLLIGAGVVTGAHVLPEEWTKPVVNSIVVPVHAQTSGTTTSSPTTPPLPTTLPLPTTTNPFVTTPFGPM